MQFPAVTALATSILVILLMGLGLYISMARLKLRQSLGTGGHGDLERRVRTHANLAEHGAFVLLCLALIETSGADRRGVMVLAGWFTLARLLHALGMFRPAPNPFRFIGSASTYTIGALAGIWLIAIALPRI